ncbi:MAG: signal recognition particle-docking protein FtsY [Oscillospiraceae bacterium]|jgi:fused signal recognition particle receptor|nr:signal recognition particle-docking protein FtsY [Oscillospiraceae bacterium]
MDEPRKGLFGKIRDRLSRSRESVAQRVDELVHNYKAIEDDFYEDLSDVLVMADTGTAAADSAIKQLKERVKAERTDDPERARAILKDILKAELRNTRPALKWPMVMLVVGVNGVGKTTTIGKLAARFKAAQHSVILCAADTFRAAAADQLSIWAERAGVPIVRHSEGADPAAVVFDAIASAKSHSTDLMLVDTAGRLHNKKQLMEELNKIHRILAREYPQADLRTLLVLDASTGQNGLIQAKAFLDTAKVNGIVLTKLDGTAKGGIVIAIQRELRLPVWYACVGEGLDDLEPFDADAFVEAIF